MFTSIISILTFYAYMQVLFLLPDPRMAKVCKSQDTNELQVTLDELLEERKQSGNKLLILVDDISQVK